MTDGSNQIYKELDITCSYAYRGDSLSAVRKCAVFGTLIVIFFAYIAFRDALAAFCYALCYFL
jgi:hypothetical protein